MIRSGKSSVERLEFEQVFLAAIVFSAVMRPSLSSPVTHTDLYHPRFCSTVDKQGLGERSLVPSALSFLVFPELGE